MGIDGVNTKIRTYAPIRSKARAKLNIDDVMPVEELPKSTDEESQGDAFKRPSSDDALDKDIEESSGGHKGRIDERI